MFKLNPPEEIKLTKRGILSQITRLFDPIGFTVRAKIGIQRLWQTGLEWDQELPTTVREEWIRFFQEMKNLNKVNVTFERPLTSLEVIKAATLCIFSDVSNEAFGACAYIRWQTKSNSFNIRFIAAKSRVAILKTADCTSFRATRSSTGNQAISVQCIIEETRVKFMKAVLFTDSNIALLWIRSHARGLKPFVSVVF